MPLHEIRVNNKFGKGRILISIGLTQLDWPGKFLHLGITGARGSLRGDIYLDPTDASILGDIIKTWAKEHKP